MDMQGFAQLRAFERRLSVFESLARGLITGQSPTELGMLSNSSISINVPVLDSDIKQTRTVSKNLAALL